jgi:hypothetical protein
MCARFSERGNRNARDDRIDALRSNGFDVNEIADA